MSDYELLRMQKLKRNSQMLSSLGLDNTDNDNSSSSNNALLSPPKRSKRPTATTTPAVATRRSTRIAKSVTGETEPLVELDDPHSWRTKLNPSVVAAAASTTTTVFDEDGEWENYTHLLTSQVLNEKDSIEGDPLLKKIYSIDISPTHTNVVAAGGHAGRVAVFSSNALMLSFQATNAWVSSVKFVGNNVLLVSSNDGKVSAFDYTMISQANRPKPLCMSTELHAGKGIFDMDVCRSNSSNDAAKLITASKDGSIAHSKFNESGELKLIRRYKEAHNGVCKSAQFAHQSEHVVVSGGNDSCVLVWDLRIHHAPQVEMKSSFGMAVNNCQFSPETDHVLVSSGFAPQIEVHDLRYPHVAGQLSSSTTTRKLKGHCPPNKQRLANIYQPVFVGNGRLVASGGGSTRLTTFDIQSGEIVHQTEMGWEANASARVSKCAADGNYRIAVSHGMRIALFDSVA